MNDYLAYYGVAEPTWAVRRNGAQTDAYLAHYQIKGAKHGVRRFQYEDGSWTPAGRERYGKGGEPRGSYGSGDNMAERIAKKVGSAVKSAGASAYRVTRDAASSAVTKAKTAHAERAAIRKEEREHKRKVRMEEWDRRQKIKSEEWDRRQKAKAEEESKSKLAAEEKRKANEIKKHDEDLRKRAPTLAKALKNKNKFTTEELEELSKRFAAEKKLADLRADEVDRGTKYIAAIRNVAGSSFDIIDYGSKLLTGKSITNHVKDSIKAKTGEKTIAEKTAEENYLKAKAQRIAAERPLKEEYGKRAAREYEEEAAKAAEETRKHYKDRGFSEAEAIFEGKSVYDDMMSIFRKTGGSSDGDSGGSSDGDSGGSSDGEGETKEKKKKK